MVSLSKAQIYDAIFYRNSLKIGFQNLFQMEGGLQLPGLQSQLLQEAGGVCCGGSEGCRWQEGVAAAGCGGRGKAGDATHQPGARAGCFATSGPARPAPHRSFPSRSRRCREAEPARVQQPPLGAPGTRRAPHPPGRPPGSRVSPAT